jgi:hypothetical protein
LKRKKRERDRMYMKLGFAFVDPLVFKNESVKYVLCEKRVLRIMYCWFVGRRCFLVGKLEGARCGKSVVEILQEIVDILDSHTKADQIFRHGACCAHLGRDTGMGHATWHTDKRVDTAKADTNTPQTGELDELFTQLDIAGLKAEHSSGPARHLGVELVLGVCLQSWVVHLELVRLQEVCNLDGVCLLTVHAYCQCLDTPHQKPAIKWTEANSCRVDCEVDFLCDGIILDGDNSGHEIVVSTEILCTGVVHNIGTQFEGLLKIRRHHGVVDDNKGIRASLVDDLCDPWNVSDLHHRVGGSLQKHKACLFREVGDDSLGVGGVDVVCLDIVVCCQEAEQSVGTWVRIVTKGRFN